jgi:hypothetical protein
MQAELVQLMVGIVAFFSSMVCWLLNGIMAFLSSPQSWLSSPQHNAICSTLSVVYVYVQHHNAILDHDELGHINCNLIVLYL